MMTTTEHARPRRAWVAAAVLVALAGAPAAAPAQSALTDLKAFYREGQVFITFKELADVAGEKYAVYRGDAPVTAATLGQARKLAVIDEGSGVFATELRLRRKVRAKKGEKPWTDQAVTPLESATRTLGYGHRYILRDNPTHDPKAMLPEGVGLFVYTVRRAGKGHYAVVPVVEGKEVASRMAATGAVQEKAELPGAVLIWKHPDGAGAVYTHWMDGATWDPLVEYGSGRRKRRTAEGPAYNFGVGVPKGYKKADKPLAVMFYGHGMGGGYSVPSSASYCRALWVWHGDKSGSWFLGTMDRKQDRVVNYAEQRVRWSAKWIAAGRANQFWKVDMRYVNAHGHSMGGTACNAWALRMGDIFCTTVDSAGATIHRRNRTWVGQAAGLWGAVDKNLPLYDRRYIYKDGKLSIIDIEVSGVWDYQDYAKWSLANMDRETAYLLISHGKRDGSVVFEPVPDFLDALQKSKRPFAAQWNMRGHSWSGYGTRNNSWGGFKIAIDETVPAFANASNNDDPRKDNSGLINGRLEWSAPGNDFDKKGSADDLVDTAALWALNIRSLSGPATVDVTPRRCKAFKAPAGGKCAWENLDFADPANPKRIASGTATADKYGLVTVEKFKVGKAGLGNRLVIRPAK